MTHVAASDVAEDTLLEMGRTLVGTDDLVAIYVPQGTEAAYQPGTQKGRVVGAVRLVAMPDGKTIHDYFHRDLDGSLRWPIGWPCEVVYAPPVDRCPVLRSLVDKHHGANAFQPYVARFHMGPFRLDPKMAKELTAFFATCVPVAKT
jgi:hypothetical protein